MDTVRQLTSESIWNHLEDRKMACDAYKWTRKLLSQWAQSMNDHTWREYWWFDSAFLIFIACDVSVDATSIDLTLRLILSDDLINLSGKTSVPMTGSQRKLENK